MILNYVLCSLVSTVFKDHLFAGLSVDGDSQGVERVRCALSAHMWPSMVLKSSDKIVQPTLPKKLGYPHSNEFSYFVL